MKHLIILISMLTAPLIIQGQDHSGEYKVVCKRVSGCPVVNGTCPTCTIVGDGFKRVTHAEIDAWAKRMQERNKYIPLENDSPKREPSGWEWDGPTWNGLRVLY
tara:strand:- start:4 stop:315 length:312 start_codon:yes stop_codon:yes gene_type:complete